MCQNPAPSIHKETNKPRGVKSTTPRLTHSHKTPVLIGLRYSNYLYFITTDSPRDVPSCPIDDCVECKNVSTCAKCKPGYYKQYLPFGRRTICRADCGLFLWPSKNEKGQLICVTEKPKSKL